MNDKTVVYKIDKDDIICEVNELWDTFAIENDGLPENSSKNVLGKKLWDFIKDPETKHIYQILIENVRKALIPITIPIMCDAPDTKRYIDIDIIPHDEGKIEFRSKIVKEVKRQRIDLLDKKIPRSDEFIKMCSYCKAVKIGEERWVDTEKAVLELKLFYKSSLPQISHGICPYCYKKVMEEIELYKQKINSV